MAACATIGAPAGLASAEESAVETIGLLQAQGYNVYIDRIGDAPLEECTVTSIRDPQTITRLVRIDRGDNRDGGKDDVDLVPVVVSKTISVSAGLRPLTESRTPAARLSQCRRGCRGAVAGKTLCRRRSAANPAGNCGVLPRVRV
jgi:hypothetical protein